MGARCCREARIFLFFLELGYRMIPFPVDYLVAFLSSLGLFLLVDNGFFFWFKQGVVLSRIIFYHFF